MVFTIFKYKKGKKHGAHKIYYKNGLLKQKEKYKKGQPKYWQIFYDYRDNKKTKNYN